MKLNNKRIKEIVALLLELSLNLTECELYEFEYFLNNNQTSIMDYIGYLIRNSKKGAEL